MSWPLRDYVQGYGVEHPRPFGDALRSLDQTPLLRQLQQSAFVHDEMLRGEAAEDDFLDVRQL